MYWEKRRETFGPKKFTMQMILSEALKDDIVAMEAGVYNLLPLKDLSGRQVLFVLPHNHTGEGYTSDSLVSSGIGLVVSLCFFYASNFLLASGSMVYCRGCSIQKHTRSMRSSRRGLAERCLYF